MVVPIHLEVCELLAGQSTFLLFYSNRPLADQQPKKLIHLYIDM
jgi:hypothetical protein